MGCGWSERRSKSLDQLNPWVYKTAELWQVKEPLPLLAPKKRNCSMVFTLKEMEEATGMFSDKNLIGKGGFGRVYRGVLKDGQILLIGVERSRDERSNRSGQRSG